MKTPREHLLDHHRQAESKLDAIRHEVVSELREDAPVSEPGPGALTVLWQELFVACRWWWRGLAAVWCLIFGLMVLGGSEDRSVEIRQLAATEPVIEAMQERMRLRDELLGLAVMEAKIAVAEPATGPRSDLFREERYV